MAVDLDVIDRKILAAVQQNCRISAEALAVPTGA